MNANPNLAVVAAIGERVQEWLSKTEEVYKPIVDHGEAHRVAIEKMTEAIRLHDDVATEKYFDEATYHEQMQRKAGADARAYFLSKVQA